MDKDGINNTVNQLKKNISDNFIVNRINFISYLVKTRKSVDGCRNKIIFAYYNCVVQAYDKDKARILAESLNNKFSTPLTSKDMNKIFSYIDGKGHLKYDRLKFLYSLNCSDEEIEIFTKAFRIQHPERIKNRKKKEERNKAIIAMRKNGVSVKEVAKTLGIGINTVSRVMKAHPLEDNRFQQIQEYRAKGLKVMEICKIMGFSKQTYYDILKKERSNQL